MQTKMMTVFRRKSLGGVLLIAALLLSGSAVWAQEDHAAHEELERASPIPLNPAVGEEVGFVYEAFLSPHQEGGEEEETPGFVPPAFRSTEPSVPRTERTSRGHAVIEFTNDLSRAYVYLAVENVNPDDVVMLHLHCGRPGQLGPIIIDFGLGGDLATYLEDNTFSVEITNEDIVAAANHGEGLVGAFTSGCPIVPTIPGDKVKTIAGMELIAWQGELYFNLHTAAQTYFGDIRGQFHLVESLPG
jgi:hypothetical protein